MKTYGDVCVPVMCVCTGDVCVYREAGQVQVGEAARLLLWRFTVQMRVVQSLHLTLLIPQPDHHLPPGHGPGQPHTLHTHIYIYIYIYTYYIQIYTLINIYTPKHAYIHSDNSWCMYCIYGVVYIVYIL